MLKNAKMRQVDTPCQVDYSLFIVSPIVVVGFVFGPCFALQYFVSSVSSFAIISPRKRGLVDLLQPGSFYTGLGIFTI